MNVEPRPNLNDYTVAPASWGGWTMQDRIISRGDQHVRVGPTPARLFRLLLIATGKPILISALICAIRNNPSWSGISESDVNLVRRHVADLRGIFGKRIIANDYHGHYRLLPSDEIDTLEFPTDAVVALLRSELRVGNIVATAVAEQIKALTQRKHPK